RVESIFEERWAALLQEYPNVTSYLQCYLYPCRDLGISYNSIIKNNVNGSSLLTELEHTIKRLLAKESKFIKLNETIGKLSVSQDEDYHNHYFKEVDISYQYFLAPAILKLQRHEINRNMHYRCHLSNLEYELKPFSQKDIFPKTLNRVTVESPRGIFFEDMFDACVIELAQLIVDLDPTRIRELWRISSINKKSKHFIVLYDNAMHLCTCLTLINYGLVCRHFFATMLISSIAKFYIGFLPRRWYTNVSVMEADSTLSNVPAISLLSNNGFGTVEHA
ncbi:11878_t:CDS:2, partial [Funneliformis caledonium]